MRRFFLVLAMPLGALGAPAAQSPSVAQPVASLTSDDFADLAFLERELEGVRIVQLGESGHGMGETFLLKSRLVRYLHRELGFDVLAFESDLYQCANAEETAAEASPRRTLMNCAFGVWHVEEVLGLFDYLKTTRTSERPLHLAGFDVQPIGRNKDHRPAYLAGLVSDDEEYAEDVRLLDELFLEIYARKGRERRTALREARDGLLDDYELLRENLKARLDETADDALRRRLAIGHQTVLSIQAYIRMQTAPTNLAYAEARNLGMAENVRFLAEKLYPGRKIIVWAHNVHVQHASERIPTNPDGGPRTPARDMGHGLREHFGNALYTIAFYAGAGQAADNARKPYDVAPPADHHLEARLAGDEHPLAFYPLRARSGWPAESQVVRYNGLHDQSLVPRDQYDGLVFLARVSLPHFLY